MRKDNFVFDRFDVSGLCMGVAEGCHVEWIVIQRDRALRRRDGFVIASLLLECPPQMPVRRRKSRAKL